MKTLLTISLLLLTALIYGQGKADNELQQFLKANKIDSFVLIQSGCASCPISYEDTTKLADTTTIWLVYKKQGHHTLINFSDTSKPVQFSGIATDIFRYLTEKRQVLKLKDKYYRDQKLLKFQAPCLATFPYENIQIKLGQFKFTQTVVDREMDHCGSNLTSENWFKLGLDILNMFDQIKTTDKKQRTTEQLQ